MHNDIIETPRLQLRKLHSNDLDGFFRLESDPAVQRYVTGLTNNTLTNIEKAGEILQDIIRQYTDCGIARLAVLEKASGRFIGLAGLKWHDETVNNHTRFYELGYRFLPQYWGMGYATEAARAAYEHGVAMLQLPHIYAFAHIDHHGSQHVLNKLGFRYIEDFDFEGSPMAWYERKCL